jgi:hypothetical protein
MKIISIITLTFFSVLIVSCGTKTNIITYSGSEPGNVKGTVKLFDSNAIAISDASGVKVAMEGTSYSTLTAADGTWELQNVPAGTYPSLMYSKNGFPTYKSYQSAIQGYLGTPGNIGAYIIGGGGTQYDGIQSFYQISNISVNLVLRAFEEDYKEITEHYAVINSNLAYVYDTLVIPNCQSTFSSRVLDNPPNKIYAYDGVLFFGKTPNIDPTDTKTFLFESCFATQGYNAGQYYANAYTGTNLTTGIADFTVNKLFLQSAGFISGEIVYCVAYFGNQFIYNNYYIDPQTGMIIFPGFSPYHSEVKSFILP